MKALVKEYCSQAQINDLSESSELARFCKNAQQLNVIKMRTISEELDGVDWFSDIAGSIWDDMSPHCPRWLIAIKAYEALGDKDPSFGVNIARKASDLELLKSEVKKSTDSFEFSDGVEDKYLEELLRFGKMKLHNTSSFLGGVAAQEATKLVMSQYIPINHTFVYDGIHGQGQVFEL